MNRWVSIAFLGLALGPGSAKAGVTYYVAANGDDTSNGLSWDAAVKSFTNAAAKAATDAGDVILVSNGTYTAWNNGGTVADGITNLVYLSKGVTLRSLKGPAETILDCGGIPSNRAVYLTHANAVLDGFTITNGNMGSQGGGVYVYNALLVTNCAVVNCIARDGGGMMLNGFVVVDNCDIVGNVASNTGGGVRTDSTNTMIMNSRIVSNIAVGSSGGGIYGNGNISNCFIKANRTSIAGGAGISLSSATLAGWVQYCIISENSATNSSNGKGGGVAITGSGRIRNCLIYNNVGREGGGIFATWLDPLGAEVYSCTIVSNYAAAGGGIRLQEYEAGVCLFPFINTLIYSNLPGNTSLNVGSLTNGFTNCCSPTVFPPSAGNITNNPLLVDWATGNYRLAAGSPCVNAGTNMDWIAAAVDLLGRPRLYYGRVDMGCYEYFLDVKVNGIPIDRIRRINGTDKNRIFRIAQ